MTHFYGNNNLSNQSDNPLARVWTEVYANFHPCSLKRAV